MGVILGNPVSEGFAIGPAYWLRPSRLSNHRSTFTTVATEEVTFHQAIQQAKLDIHNLIEKFKSQNQSDALEVLEAHLQLVDDPEVIDSTMGLINNKLITASAAYTEVIQNFKQMFSSMEDEYLRSRVLDLEDISNRVLFYISEPKSRYDQDPPKDASILLANDLTPSQILGLDRNLILALATAQGSPTSHVSILARSMEFPAIVGLGDQIHSIKNLEKIRVNAVSGEILTNSSDEITIEKFNSNHTAYLQKKEILKLFKGKESKTQSGKKITLSANISGPQDIESVINNDAEAIGLYRTEFLYLDRNLPPPEQEQIKIYKAVAERIGSRHLTIRTLDIGGDKECKWLQIQKEDNPFLGLRGIRLCLAKPELFKTQLRSLLQAMHNKNWSLMFPMITTVDELLQAKKILDQVKTELKSQNKSYSEKFDIGIMVEVPAVAWMLDLFAQHIDFISLGTNDLLQYTCAADRLNQSVSHLYDPNNQGFQRLLEHVITTGKKNKLHVSVCGSLAHHKNLVPQFIDWGVDELSMTPQHILPTRKLIAEI